MNKTLQAFANNPSVWAKLSSKLSGEKRSSAGYRPGNGATTRVRLLALGSLLCCVISSVPEGWGASYYFDCTSGNVQTASCWSSNVKPGSSDVARIGNGAYLHNVSATLSSGTFAPAEEYIGGYNYNYYGQLFGVYGTVNHTGGTNGNINSTYISIGAGVGQQNGIYNLSSQGVVNANILYLGNLYGTGAMNQSGGVANTNLLDISNTGSTFSLSGSGQLSTGREDLSGTFNQTGGTHVVNTSIGSSGTYNLRGGNLNVNPSAQGGGIFGGTWNIDGGNVNVGGGNGVMNPSTLNLGTLAGYNGSHILGGNGSITAYNETIGVSGTGTFTQTGGTHQVSNILAIAQNAGSVGTFNLQGGTLKANTIDAVSSGSAMFNFDGGSLSVNQFIGNLQNNGGVLTPGSSPGTTSISGDYAQSASGTYLVEIGGLVPGTQYDVLNVSGTASLDGMLDVNLVDFGSGTFSPSAGDKFDILTADFLSGTFQSLTWAPLLSPDLHWQIDYLQDAAGSTDVVRLSVVSSVPIPGALWLFGSGLMGVIGWSNRKNGQRGKIGWSRL